MNETETEKPLGFAARTAALFLNSKLTPIIIVASLMLGLFAVWQLPREEEPQIQVPIVDVFAALPGASPQEVENRLTRPLEKLFWEVPDVEYLYSASAPGNAQWIVRFKVGTRIEDALVRLHQKVLGNADRLPAGATTPLLKSRTIDDVPILALTFHSSKVDSLSLRRIAAQFEDVIKAVPAVAETTLIGGQRRALRVELDPVGLAAHGLTAAEIEPAVRSANLALQSGSRPFANQERVLETGGFLLSVRDAGAVVVSARGGAPLFLRDVARVTDGAEEPTSYVFHRERGGVPEVAVTISVAKRPGANAISVVDAVLARVESARQAWLPPEVQMTITRDYGHTAAEKSNELLLHMGIAVFGVAVLILFFLGWRESLVVMLAIPTTLALTLLVFYLYGYTLNRITLFALIFSIGILVDDAIVVVENIVRHVRRPGAESKTLYQVALEAVDEVGNPTLLATWAVIAAILPMAFVGGLMGPYMRPIPIGSTAAMLFSVAIAFAITPWAAIRVLKRRSGTLDTSVAHDPDHAPDDFFTRLYHRIMEPLLDRRGARWAFLGGIAALLAGSAALVLVGAVEVKMLPFDNKSEFQVVLKTPEGTTLEETTRIALEMAEAVQGAPEVRDVQVYAGAAAPFNFNGLVRHYYLRRGPNVADLQVNLVEKGRRSDQSHAIAKRVRPALVAIARRHGATVTVAEVPPGPPVLQSIVAEIYGPDETQRLALATEVRAILERTEGVVDVDWFVEAPQPKVRFEIDRAKAALSGVSLAEIVATLDLAARSRQIGLYHLEGEREDVPLVLELPAGKRSEANALLGLQVRGAGGRLLPLSELVTAEAGVVERTLHRKNLKPVTYVTADVAGSIESPAYAMASAHAEIAKLDLRRFGSAQGELPVYHLNTPGTDTGLALKWDGEWHITLEVFRDLGLAFAAVLVLIAMLMVGWFGSYKTPLVVMAAIPFSLVGILPAHWAMGAFFTATSMIGFMAGAGIVVRNSIILVDFIELRRSHGLALRDAVIEAGAVRFRPMLLTALAVVVGASVILADPIFQGLAISLMFGELASLLISRMAVPVLYFMSEGK
ncbi:efflux RND transporter permease subunit [Nibricoccus sp. IMCC34717]|uniref:efflux RND transporter permease subunit n=1 Tax=Nibricoccus sp. IMCC34717 TaxID=3034021 RepID=UPI00384B9148